MCYRSNCVAAGQRLNNQRDGTGTTRRGKVTPTRAGYFERNGKQTSVQTNPLVGERHNVGDSGIPDKEKRHNLFGKISAKARRRRWTMEEHDGGEIIRSKKLSDALKGHRSGRRTHASSVTYGHKLTAEFLLLRTRDRAI